MRVNKLISTLLVAAISGFMPALAQDNTDDEWRKRSDEGWFFYNELPPEEEPEEPEKTEIPPAPPPTPPEPTQPSPAIMNTAWLKENLPVYLNQAIDDPTPENVEAYYLLQKLALDRAQVFSQVTARVVTGHPVLDQNNRRPTSTSGGNALDREAEKNKREILASLSDRMGLFVFLDDTANSALQLQIVEYFETSAGYGTVKISIDPFDEAAFNRGVRPDHGHAAEFGVSTYPSIYAVSPDGRRDQIAGNSISMTELFDRTLISAHRLNILSDEEYFSTQKFNHRDEDIPTRADTDENTPFTSEAVRSALNAQGDYRE
ncbi:conjugal transfer protein TraF [uncultured Umboniibacter sp.]|uniref:conjugal transfer protein TraF n=1 Tax=uncultured Umboniibacter sp. TaxID=1798917 RepID=UPI00261A1C53|nr:conjugal transfer protein TraF [uncultured Umboniibacter sp.]